MAFSTSTIDLCKFLPEKECLLVKNVPFKKCISTNIVIDDHGYDGNHTNGIIDLTDKGIGV